MYISFPMFSVVCPMRSVDKNEMAEKLRLEVDRIIKVCWMFGLHVDVLYEIQFVSCR